MDGTRLFLDMGFFSRCCRCILILGLGRLSATGAGGEDVVVPLSRPLTPVMAGSSASLWMNVLNISTQQVLWTFPPKITSQIVSAQGRFDGLLELKPADTNAMTIAPDAFARREYQLILPASVTGQVVVAFTSLDAGRAVFDVQPATNVVIKTPSLFARFLFDAEPEKPATEDEPEHFFKEHIAGYEPFYFIAGPKSPNAKFQISFQYQLLDNEGPLAQKEPALKGFHLAFTQTSLWDLNAPSAPFYDTSYKPEFFYSWNRAVGGEPDDWFRLDLQAGLKHESNGKSGADSRSMNIAYLRPTFVFGKVDDLQLTLQPRALIHLTSLSDNPDLPDYRGYVDLRAIVGWQRGLQLSALERMGNHFNHSGLQLDLTYPTMRISGSFSLYLDVQYFTGYSESLLGYNKRTDEFRAGFSLYR